MRFINKLINGTIIYIYIDIYTYIVKLTWTANTSSIHIYTICVYIYILQYRAPKEGTPMTGRKSESFLWVIMFPNKPGISQVRLIQMNNRAITGCVS